MHTNRNTPDRRNATQPANRPTEPAKPEIEGSLVEWQRSETERVAVVIGEFEGKRFVQIRLYFLGQNGVWLPTRKGCSVRRHELRSVIKALEAAERELNHPDREERRVARDERARSPLEGLVTTPPTGRQGGAR